MEASNKDAQMGFHESLSEEEKAFYVKAYPNVDFVREKKVHCTVCKIHIGTAPSQEPYIKMHPILRVTHCTKCHDFYNSGEFSKGEDGSELYCRWCGQGGEVYCCSDCPYVFCKSCITKNLSRGVVADIEQNENWRCFGCAPKILWPLRAQHWALFQYIAKQKRDIEAMNLTEDAKQIELCKDRSSCCRLAKSKCSNMSDSLESLESGTSRRSSSSNKKKASDSHHQPPAAKRAKTSNNEVVCTPDLLSMLEPDCQLTTPPKGASKSTASQSPGTIITTPKVVSVHQNYIPSSVPPPLVLRNTQVQLKQSATPNGPKIIRRPVSVSAVRTPSPSMPVYHTINGFRVDLNTAARQEHYRLPNGKLIQVRRSDANNQQRAGPAMPGVSGTLTQRQANLPGQSRYVIHSPSGPIGSFPQQQQQQQFQQSTRYPNVSGSTLAQLRNHIQMVNGMPTPVSGQQHPGVLPGQPVTNRPMLVKHIFPGTPIGQARAQLQNEVFSLVDICQHLTGKIQTLTNSNAYKQVKNNLDVKELYIHLSYLLTYANGRFKGLQEKCLDNMRQLGFTSDADSLENGQLAAGVDYVRHNKLVDVEIFNTGPHSFHHQIHEYRQRLLDNLYNDDDTDGTGKKGPQQPLSPLMPLSSLLLGHSDDEDEGQDNFNDNDDDNNYSKSNDATNDMPDYDEPTIRPESFMESYMKEDFNDDDDENSMFERSSLNEYGGQRGNDDNSRNETQAETHAYDRKLSRLIRKYPSIWCTRHPDYGNFEITRKYWRAIASKFKHADDIKIRWKNLRKRFVRIERRTQEGKRFNGYFDKGLNFLTNRDLPMENWLTVDCGSDDDEEDDDNNKENADDDVSESTGFSRRHRDAERSSNYTDAAADNSEMDPLGFGETSTSAAPSEPIEIRQLDLKIIQFVKSNPVLWRKSSDARYDKMDDQTRKGLWLNFWRSMPERRCDDLIERWKHLYAMYKAFRLKSIKPQSRLQALELKYSKYLAKLHFLFKIDEEELNRDNYQMEDYLSSDTEEDEYDEDDGGEKSSLLKMPDDKEFTLHLVRTIREYPQIWNKRHIDYCDVVARDRAWMTIAQRLQYYGHKQASDDEGDEIQIVEPKTDVITLDSDDEQPPSKRPNIKQEGKSPTNQPKAARPQIVSKAQVTQPMQMQIQLMPMTAAHPTSSAAATASSSARQATATALMPEATANMSNVIITQVSSANSSPEKNNSTRSGAGSDNELVDFMSTAHSLLASMLEVEITEGVSSGSSSSTSHAAAMHRKQPRKKTTVKPNPELLKQKELMLKERLDAIKRNDPKLKKKCKVMLNRVENEYDYAKQLLLQTSKAMSPRENQPTAVDVTEKVEVEKPVDNTSVVATSDVAKDPGDTEKQADENHVDSSTANNDKAEVEGGVEVAVEAEAEAEAKAEAANEAADKANANAEQVSMDHEMEEESPKLDDDHDMEGESLKAKDNHDLEEALPKADIDASRVNGKELDHVENGQESVDGSSTEVGGHSVSAEKETPMETDMSDSKTEDPDTLNDIGNGENEMIQHVNTEEQRNTENETASPEEGKGEVEGEDNLHSIESNKPNDDLVGVDDTDTSLKEVPDAKDTTSQADDVAKSEENDAAVAVGLVDSSTDHLTIENSCNTSSPDCSNGVNNQADESNKQEDEAVLEDDIATIENAEAEVEKADAISSSGKVDDSDAMVIDSNIVEPSETSEPLVSTGSDISPDLANSDNCVGSSASEVVRQEPTASLLEPDDAADSTAAPVNQESPTANENLEEVPTSTGGEIDNDVHKAIEDVGN